MGTIDLLNVHHAQHRALCLVMDYLICFHSNSVRKEFNPFFFTDEQTWLTERLTSPWPQGGRTWILLFYFPSTTELEQNSQPPDYRCLFFLLFDWFCFEWPISLSLSVSVSALEPTFTLNPRTFPPYLLLDSSYASFQSPKAALVNSVINTLPPRNTAD